jgi:hypothetical protein
MTDGNRRPERQVAVRWQNFRAFGDTGWVPLRPLTFLLGPNSAGKSSFIAPLLLLKQSLLSRTGTNALLTRGDYLDIGVYEDFVRNHETSTPVHMALRWRHRPAARGERRPKVGHHPPGAAEFVFKQGSDVQSVALQSFRVWDPYGRTLLHRDLDAQAYSSNMVAPPKNKRAREAKRRRSKADIASRRAMRAAIRNAMPEDFLFRSLPVRQAGMEARLEAEDGGDFATRIDDDRALFYCNITDFTEWSVRQMLDSLHYIGPLREAPKRVYELSGEMPSEVGTRGEFAPEIVYRWRNDMARMTDVRKWLAHFGFNEDLDLKTVGTGGFSLMLSRGGSPVASTFVDTGFGMSQVLPLIVQGLLAEKNDWLVIEQPEIHLNPRLQAALADLFVAIVDRKINLIIESHSEHLLLRLRRLAANEKLVVGDAGLYFVEQESGESSIRPIPLREDGFIDTDDWPSGFFEDSLRESMSLAEEQFRSRRRRERRARLAARRAKEPHDA